MQEGIYNHCSTLASSTSGDREVVLLPPFGYLWEGNCFLESIVASHELADIK